MALGLFAVRFGIAVALALHIAGCSHFDFAGDRDRLLDEARERGWRSEVVRTRAFDVFTAASQGAKSGLVTVYLEGDGLAWRDPYTPSNDPTPERPVALRLALADGASNVAYIARPCQYRDLARTPGCDVRFWTTHRLAPSVIASLSEAIDHAKRLSGASRVELVGYSGGGAAAVLVAAQRRDVARLVTVSANLDLGLWARLVAVHPLHGSSNPMDVARIVAAVPQLHMAGADDEIVPKAVIRSFVAAAGLDEAALLELRGYDHTCCWHREWGERIASIRQMVPLKPPPS